MRYDLSFRPVLLLALLAPLMPLTSAGSVLGQTPSPSTVRQRVREYRVSHDAAITRELADFVAIPILATDSVNIRRNANRLVQMMSERGISARILESANGGPPAVFGEFRTVGATKTVVFYAHYDGQPIGDTTQWVTKPWQPVLRDKALD